MPEHIVQLPVSLVRFISKCLSGQCFIHFQLFNWEVLCLLPMQTMFNFNLDPGLRHNFFAWIAFSTSWFQRCVAFVPFLITGRFLASLSSAWSDSCIARPPLICIFFALPELSEKGRYAVRKELTCIYVRQNLTLYSVRPFSLAHSWEPCYLGRNVRTTRWRSVDISAILIVNFWHRWSRSAEMKQAQSVTAEPQKIYLRCTSGITVLEMIVYYAKSSVAVELQAQLSHLIESRNNYNRSHHSAHYVSNHYIGIFRKDRGRFSFGPCSVTAIHCSNQLKSGIARVFVLLKKCSRVNDFVLVHAQ